jgi:hypothetical protein
VCTQLGERGPGPQSGRVDSCEANNEFVPSSARSSCSNVSEEDCLLHADAMSSAQQQQTRTSFDSAPHPSCQHCADTVNARYIHGRAVRVKGAESQVARSLLVARARLVPHPPRSREPGAEPSEGKRPTPPFRFMNANEFPPITPLPSPVAPVCQSVDKDNLRALALRQPQPKRRSSSQRRVQVGM